MTKFYICKHCGNVVAKVIDVGVPIICCGEEMHELVANTTDASQEKHVPVVKVDGNYVDVNVGSVDHPMQEDHYIQFIYIETKHGGQKKILKPNDLPHARFALVEDEVVAVYEYCNLHGLWKYEVK